MTKKEIKAIIEKAINEGRYNVLPNTEEKYLAPEIINGEGYDEELTEIVDAAYKAKYPEAAAFYEDDESFPYYAIARILRNDIESGKISVIVSAGESNGEDEYNLAEFAEAFGE